MKKFYSKQLILRRALMFVIIFFCACVGSAKEVTRPYNFQQAKTIAKQIFFIYPETIYSGCGFDLLHHVDFATCEFEPNPKRPRDLVIEFEHMLPMSHIKHHFACWKKPLCVNTKGKKYGGSRCCQHISQEFNQLEAELFNVWPEIGTINRIRSNYKFTEFTNQQKQQLGYYRGLPLYVDFNHKEVEPRDSVKGIVARALLFMVKKYHIILSKDQLKLFNNWNKQYPPRALEIAWAKKIAKIEGYENDFIVSNQYNGIH